MTTIVAQTLFTAIYTSTILVCGYFLLIKKSPKEKEWLTKIDDKHYIVNNELVSFDEDDEYKKMKQEAIDMRYYMSYESRRLMNLYTLFDEMHCNTITAISKDPSLKDTYTHKDIINMYEKYYYEYSKVIDKLNSYYGLDLLGKLTVHEYIIKEKNPIECRAMLGYGTLNFVGELYNVVSPKHAKYMYDTKDILEADFKEKWMG